MCADIALPFARAHSNGHLLSHFVETLTIGAMASTAKANASAEQPAPKTHLPLSMLNKASAKAGGTWNVYFCRPGEDKYEYMWQGKPRQGANFLATLVCAENPSLYCQAQFKKTSANGVKYQQALNAFKHGHRYIMSKVALVEDAKLAYVSCPVKHVVDISKTKLDLCVEAPHSAVQPAPTATIAGSIGLGGNQFFDIAALIQEVQDTRQHENNRSSFLVRIYDGSHDIDSPKSLLRYGYFKYHRRQ